MLSLLKYHPKFKFKTHSFSCKSCHWLKKSGENVNEKISLVKQEFPDFTKYVNSNFSFISDGYSCFIVECRLCIRRKECTLAYIIKKTGLFLCPNCDEARNFQDFDQFKKLKLKTKNVLLPYQSPYQNLIPISKGICDMLKISGLNAEVLNSIGTLYNSELKLFHFPLKNAINQTVGEKIYDITNQKELTYQRKIKAGLLIYGAENKKKAVIVSNIKDYLTIVAENLGTHAVVCLPYFLLNLPQECLPAFEKFNELIFWFDCDSTDWDAARSISQKLNENRCYVIRPTINEPSPYKAYKRGIDIRKILIKATPVLHKSITTFETLKQDVFCELQNIEKVNGVKWKRFPVLNKLLKGHRKGELTIITGPTGSGKTTFMSEYSLDLALQGVSTLWGSFELRNSRLAAILLRQFVGYSLEKKLNEFDHWATEFEKYPLYFMTFHGQESIQIVMDTIEHARYVFDISHVIIDNLQFMMGTSSFYKKDKFWEQDEIISSFRSFATQKNVHVTLVVHPRKERNEEDLTTNSVFGSAKATQEADNVLIIQEKRLVHSKSKKFLQIAKNRFCGDLGFMPLEFDKEGLSYSNLKKQN